MKDRQDSQAADQNEKCPTFRQEYSQTSIDVKIPLTDKFIDISFAFRPHIYVIHRWQTNGHYLLPPVLIVLGVFDPDPVGTVDFGVFAPLDSLLILTLIRVLFNAGIFCPKV